MSRTISFRVDSVTERMLNYPNCYDTDGNVITVFDTVLVSYGPNAERLTIRGNPWKVGEKVDFNQITVQKGLEI